MRGFGLYCNTQTKIRRSKLRGWRGNGTLCRLWGSGESQPFFESWFKDVDWGSSWLNCNFTPQTNLTPKRERWAGKWFTKYSSCSGLGSGIVLSSVWCVTKPALTYDSQNKWRKWNMTQCYFLDVSIRNSCKTYSLKQVPKHIPRYMYCSKGIPLFAFCLMMPFSVSSIHQKRRADPDVNHTSLPELVGLPQCVPFGNLGRRKQMPSALWAFHARSHPALWIEKCSYSINAPFKILLQQHSSLYCNYTYCISLYSDP